MAEAAGRARLPVRPWLDRIPRPRSLPVSLAVATILLFAVLAVAAPLIAPDPNLIVPRERLQFVGVRHWLGTDGLGRDLFARIAHGGGISLTVGLSVAVLSSALGLLIGLVAGYFRTADLVIMRVIDAIMAIPTLLLAVAMTMLAEPSVLVVVAALVVPDVPKVVRVIRADVLSLRTRTYITAAVASGTGPAGILAVHLLPNLLPPLSVQTSYICASAILQEAGLSFIGAGMPAETPSWGVIVAENRQYFVSAPWTILFPGMCMAALILAVMVLGDSLRGRYGAGAHAGP
jgi:peptide/nickel transport system permease protein